DRACSPSAAIAVPSHPLSSFSPRSLLIRALRHAVLLHVGKQDVPPSGLVPAPPRAGLTGLHAPGPRAMLRGRVRLGEQVLADMLTLRVWRAVHAPALPSESYQVQDVREGVVQAAKRRWPRL